MKVEKIEKKIEPAFSPVTIQLTFEKEDELIAFYMIFNHSFIIDATGIGGVLNSVKIKEALGYVNYHKQWNSFENSLSERFKKNSW